MERGPPHERPASEAIPYLSLNGARLDLRPLDSKNILLRNYSMFVLRPIGLHSGLERICFRHCQRHVRSWTPCLNAVHEARVDLVCV